MSARRGASFIAVAVMAACARDGRQDVALEKTKVGPGPSQLDAVSSSAVLANPNPPSDAAYTSDAVSPPTASNSPSTEGWFAAVDSPCTPLDQILRKEDCAPPTARRLDPLPIGWSDPIPATDCLPAERNKVVRVGLDPHSSVTGSPQCHSTSFVLSGVPHVPPETLCDSACGPHSFQAEIVGNGGKIVFRCETDMLSLEGIISFDRGALVKNVWNVPKGSPTPPVLDRKVYPLPCGASVSFHVRSSASNPSGSLLK
jgi:hypothetical protein